METEYYLQCDLCSNVSALLHRLKKTVDGGDTDC